MSVKKNFWDDPYKTSLATTVVGVNGNKVTLNETIFYAFSGGQASDKGTIGGFEVLEAKKDREGNLLYFARISWTPCRRTGGSLN